MSLRRRIGLLLCCCTLSAVFAADAPPTAEELFPERTVAALVLPSLLQARNAASGTWLADMYSQPEMQEFLQPAVNQMKATYAELRPRNHLLPATGDLDDGLLAGEIAVCIYGRADE